MNILRKALADEAARLKPLLDRCYHAILRFQEQRTPANEAKLREAMAPTVEQLMVFKPYMPTYKQEYFDLLSVQWQRLAPGDLIMLFDHCVNIMHLRMERAKSANEAQQPWSQELLNLLNQRRDTPDLPAPEGGDYLCSGLPAAPGQATGPARVIDTPDQLPALQPGEIMVCRMSTPDWLPYLHRIRAIVTDIGGTLCHAAIVARELGIPCVTACKDATTTIQTGTKIAVDGDLGLVVTA